MVDRNELVMSTNDAATLSAVLATLSTREAPAPEAAEELAEILDGVTLVPNASARDVIGLDAEVTYVELPRGRANRAARASCGGRFGGGARFGVRTRGACAARTAHRRARAGRAARCRDRRVARRRGEPVAEAVMMSRLVERLAARGEFRRGVSMLQPECPIEQTSTCASIGPST